MKSAYFYLEGINSSCMVPPCFTESSKNWLVMEQNACFLQAAPSNASAEPRLPPGCQAPLLFGWCRNLHPPPYRYQGPYNLNLFPSLYLREERERERERQKFRCYIYIYTCILYTYSHIQYTYVYIYIYTQILRFYRIWPRSSSERSSERSSAWAGGLRSLASEVRAALVGLGPSFIE